MATLTFSCPSCKAGGEVDDKFIGKMAKCRNCGTQFQITAPFEFFDAPEPDDSPRNIEKAIDTALEEIKQVNHGNFIAEVFKSPIPVCVVFYAKTSYKHWPGFHKIATYFAGKMKFVRCEFEESHGLAYKFLKSKGGGNYDLPSAVVFYGEQIIFRPLLGDFADLVIDIESLLSRINFTHDDRGPAELRVEESGIRGAPQPSSKSDLRSCLNCGVSMKADADNCPYCKAKVQSRYPPSSVAGIVSLGLKSVQAKPYETCFFCSENVSNPYSDLKMQLSFPGILDIEEAVRKHIKDVVVEGIYTNDYWIYSLRSAKIRDGSISLPGAFSVSAPRCQRCANEHNRGYGTKNDKGKRVSPQVFAEYLCYKVTHETSVYPPPPPTQQQIAQKGKQDSMLRMVGLFIFLFIMMLTILVNLYGQR